MPNAKQCALHDTESEGDSENDQDSYSSSKRHHGQPLLEKVKILQTDPRRPNEAGVAPGGKGQDLDAEHKTNVLPPMSRMWECIFGSAAPKLVPSQKCIASGESSVASKKRAAAECQPTGRRKKMQAKFVQGGNFNLEQEEANAPIVKRQTAAQQIVVKAKKQTPFLYELPTSGVCVVF